MFDLNYKQLINEKKVYVVTYGRGAIVGVMDKPLDDMLNDLYTMVRDSHGQEPMLVTEMDIDGDDLIICLEKEYDPEYPMSKKIRIKKKIPLYQVTFEMYEEVFTKSIK